jgi:PQQ-dependent dehydrogenase (methanol/ethanol family)
MSLLRHSRAARLLRRSIAIGLLSGTLIASSAAAGRPPANIGWPLIGNTAQNTHFASLAQINTGNLSRLRVAWTRAEGFGEFNWESFPVVVGSTMYYTTDDNEVVAVNASSGRRRWSYAPAVDFLTGPQGSSVVPVSRGVTVADGRVYELTADDQLIALRAATGQPIWDVRVADPAEGYTENSPGTIWNGEIIIGGPAGDAGLRAFVAAYDARSGRQLWRKYVIPRRGEGWLSGGGAHGGGDVWMPPTVDAQTGSVYLATGDPTPAFSNEMRKGCDRWADATVALNARTGRLEWAHTEFCEDSWDYDTDQSPVLFDVRLGGHTVRAVGDGNKSGFYSILNAHTGALIARSPELVPYSTPHLVPTTTGTLVCPGIFGGLEYGPPAYSAKHGMVYLPGIDMCMNYTVNAPGTIVQHRSGAGDLAGTATQVGEATGMLAAVSADTGRLAWRTPLPRPAVGGALATAGGLVFAGDDDGYLYALDQNTGVILRRIHIGLRFGSAPIAYEINGIEYLAVVAGGSQVSVAGDAPPGEGKLVVFRLEASGGPAGRR